MSQNSRGAAEFAAELFLIFASGIAAGLAILARKCDKRTFVRYFSRPKDSVQMFDDNISQKAACLVPQQFAGFLLFYSNRCALFYF